MSPQMKPEPSAAVPTSYQLPEGGELSEADGDGQTVAGIGFDNGRDGEIRTHDLSHPKRTRKGFNTRQTVSKSII